MIKDKLTKRRKRIDYVLIIALLNMESDFLFFQNSHKRIKTSLNRQARCFLMHKKVYFENIYNDYVSRGIDTFEKYQKECIRLASDCSCWED